MLRPASLVVMSLLSLVALPLAARAEPITFTTEFSGLNEVPANASPGFGQATVVFDPVAHTLLISAQWSDLLGVTSAAHIHCCTDPGANVGVATAVPSFPGFPLGVSSGTYAPPAFDTTVASTFSPAFLTANGGTPAGAEAALLAGLLAGRAYFNIHTDLFPGGEIRGNLTAVPEPASLVLMGVGVTGILMRRRRPA